MSEHNYTETVQHCCCCCYAHTYIHTYIYTHAHICIGQQPRRKVHFTSANVICTHRKSLPYLLISHGSLSLHLYIAYFLPFAILRASRRAFKLPPLHPRLVMPLLTGDYYFNVHNIDHMYIYIYLYISYVYIHKYMYTCKSIIGYVQRG